MRNYWRLWVCCFLITGCFKTSEFIPDKDNSQLPEYAESGSNTGGALMNDTVWRSNVYISSVPPTYMSGCYIFSRLSGDSTTIIFNGKHTYQSIPFIDTMPDITVNFFFVFKGLKIENQDSLLKLNGKTYNIDGVNNYVVITHYSNDLFNILKNSHCSGHITFNKVQKVGYISFGDGSPGNPQVNPFIISGHFDFTVNDPGQCHVKDGRFDMVVTLRSNMAIQR